LRHQKIALTYVNIYKHQQIMSHDQEYNINVTTSFTFTFLLKIIRILKASFAAPHNNIGCDPRTISKLAIWIGTSPSSTMRHTGLALLTPFNIAMINIDDRGCYSREVSKKKHLIGKIFTQQIERKNLIILAHINQLARKTICFSHSIDIHRSFHRKAHILPIEGIAPF